MIDSILTNTMLPAISQQLLERQVGDEEKVKTIRVSVTDNEFDYDIQ